MSDATGKEPLLDKFSRTAVGVLGYSRELTSDELTGTFQAFLDACKADVETAEGI